MWKIDINKVVSYYLKNEPCIEAGIIPSIVPSAECIVGGVTN